MIQVLNYVAGKFDRVGADDSLDIVNPAKGVTIGHAPRTSADGVDRAVKAAASAFEDWRAVGPKERSSWLNRIADEIEKNSDELARAESLNTGKPLRLAREVDIPRAASNFRFFAETLQQFKGDAFTTSPTAQSWTQYSPLGAVACISPWNLPIYLLTWKIAPALAAGNTVVAKPSEVTPYTAFLLSEIVSELKLPRGVLNVVHGLGGETGAALVEHPLIQAVSFTGSTATGRLIAQAVAPQFKKVSLEMGGKNPTLIFADCDFDRAVETTVRAAFQNQGQICLCGSRILVERPIYDRFVQAIVKRTQSLKVGDPSAGETDQGALVSKAHYDKVLSFLDLARREGASVLCGGRAVNPLGEFSKGFFIEPTLLADVNEASKLNQEEIFGPVATVMPFDSEDEALRIANGTVYGLSASVWSQDPQRAQRVADQLEAGLVWINSWMIRDLRVPFGGVKQSGLGREGGFEALKFFSEVKSVTAQT